MNVDIAINRSKSLPVAEAQALELLENVESALQYFPKLKKLRALGDGLYEWQMKTIGSRAARVAYDTRFTARTRLAEDRLSWVPAKTSSASNAELAGEIIVAAEGEHSRLTIKVSGTLQDVPVPLLYRPMAAPFIRGKFISLADGFLENVAAALTASEASVGGARLGAHG